MTRLPEDRETVRTQPRRATSGAASRQLLLDAPLYTPSPQVLPTTIAQATAICGRTFDDIWLWNIASGNITGAAGNVLTVVGTPRFNKTVPGWNGTDMTSGFRGVEFTGTGTGVYFTAAAGKWQLTQSITWVFFARCRRPTAANRGIIGTRLGSAAANAGYHALTSTGAFSPLQLVVSDGTTATTASAPTITNEIDGFSNGAMHWFALKMNLTTNRHQVLAYRTAGTEAVTPSAGSRSGGAAVQIGGQAFLFDPELLQIAWSGVLVGAEAEAFTVDSLNALDTWCDTPSPITNYVRQSCVSPRVAYESGFGLRTQTCHGSSVTTGLVHFPHMYHPSATLSTQKLSAYFARGASVALINKRNEFTHSDDLANAAWTKSNITATANNAEDPEGFTGAARLTATANNATISQTKIVDANKARSHSFFVRRNQGTDVALMLRAYDVGNAALVVEAAKTATSEWTRIDLLSQSELGTSIRYELEIVTSGDSIHCTFGQSEYGWLTEYQPQRGTLVDRDDPEYSVAASGRWNVHGGRVEVVAVQYADNLVEDQYLFSTEPTSGTNADRVVMQISDHNDAFRGEVLHWDSAENQVVKLDQIPNIDRNAEATYAYEWEATRPIPGYTVRSVAVQNGTDSITGTTVPTGTWPVSAPTAVTELHIGARYTHTAHLEGGIERVRIWGRL